MRVLSLDDVEKMAEAVVAEHLDEHTPLDEGLARKASTEGLNPDQVTNLVQLANVLTHLKLFDQKNDGDKIINFEPIDPNLVLKKVYSNTDPETGISEKVIVMEGNSSSGDPMRKALDFFGDLPNASTQMESSESMPCCGESEGGSHGADHSVAIIRIRKVAEDLRDRREAMAIEYGEELDKLAADFAQLYGPDLVSFEKEAVQVYGTSAADVLSTLRSRLRLPATDYAFPLVKKASVVDTDTPQFDSLRTLMKLAADWLTIQEACDYVQTNFGGVL